MYVTQDLSTQERVFFPGLLLLIVYYIDGLCPLLLMGDSPQSPLELSDAQYLLNCHCLCHKRDLNSGHGMGGIRH